MLRDPWFPFGTGDGTVRLFCLPFAGGGASAFASWRRALPGVAVVPVQYPGRETRLDEPSPTDLDRLVGELAAALAPWTGDTRTPYALLGYSLGARIAFALTHRLAAWGLPGPRALHVVAHRAPDRPPPHPGAARLADDAFCRHVRAYGGTPDEVFQTPELAELLIPILRADFALVEQPVALTPVDCPIHAWAGSEDPLAGPGEMARWREFTRHEFRSRTFPGGHFFTRSASGFLPALAESLAGGMNHDAHGIQRGAAISA